jgi:O-antigen/teichoic acid export membrane protein
LGLITLPIISRAFGPDVFGRWNTLLTMLGYVSIPFTAGIAIHGVREIAKGNENEVGRILSSRLLLCILSYLISLVILYFVIGVAPEFISAMALGIIYLIANAINVEYYYLGTSNFKIPAISQFIGQLFYLAGVVLFIRNQGDFIKLAIVYFLYYLLSSGILLFKFPHKKNIHLKFSLKDSFRLIMSTYRIGISGIIENFSISLPVILLSAFIGNYETGIFSASFKLIAIFLLGFHIILTVVAPDFIKLKGKGRSEIFPKVKLTTFIFLLMGLSASVFSYFFGAQIITFVYGDKFNESIPLLKLFSFLYLPMMPLSMLFNGLLIYFEHDKLYLRTTIISCVVLFISAPLLIIKFSATGAVCAMSFYMVSYMSFAAFYIFRELRALHD